MKTGLVIGYMSIVIAFIHCTELLCSSVAAQGPSEQVATSIKMSQAYFFTTKVYQEKALQVFIEEVNTVAKDLGLSEDTFITSNKLVEIYISPPASDMLGTISTSNFSYYIRGERKFAGLDRRNVNAVWAQDRNDYSWPIGRLDTNAAFRDGTQLMAAAGMNVAALNRDCIVDLRATMPGGPKAGYFVPDYWISWGRAGKNVALLAFLQPGKKIRTLQVYDPAYIARKSVNVPNLGELLRQGNAPKVLLERMGLEPTNHVEGSNAPNRPQKGINQ